MADVLKLKRDATELTLLASEGNGLRVQKWFPKMADTPYVWIPPYLAESMDVLVDRTSHDDLATSMQALDQMRRWAAMYRREPLLREPVWLHAKMGGETGERRAYVRAIHGEWRSDQMGGAGHPAAYDALGRLQLERHPFWEAPSAVTGTALSSPASEIAISHNYGSPAGDVGARIREFVIDLDAAADSIDRLWLGLRSTKFGTPGNFVPIWEFEDGSITGPDCGAPVADATASPGGAGNTKRVVSFAGTPGWASRCGIEVEDVSANYTDQIGRFLWLFRYKVDAGTECEVHLRWGSSFAAITENYIDGPIKVADNTNWDFLEMGEQQIPPHDMKPDITTSKDRWVQGSVVYIRARRTSGSGSLHLDCLCLIPLDEGYLIAKDIGCSHVNYFVKYYKMPNDNSIALVLDALEQPRNWPAWSEDNFDLPPGSGNVIVVHTRSTQSVLADAITIPTIQWYPRWANLRGSE